MKAPNLRGFRRRLLAIIPHADQPSGAIISAREGNAALVSPSREEMHGWLQVVAAVPLAVYPWAHAFGYVTGWWLVWLFAVGLHGIWMALRPTRNVVLPAISLVLILGLWLILGLLVYRNIVGASIQRDYLTLASEIFKASRDLAAAPVNLERPGSYLQMYFDPLVPLLNRVFDLTRSPFRFLAFHAGAILSPSLATWWIIVRQPSLRAFQMLLPVAFLLHPSVALTVQADYHTSGIGLSLLLLGSYYFYAQRRWLAFVLLLLGTLTRISYWPCWMMFGLLSGSRREWRWAGAYLGVGLAALTFHHYIQGERATRGVTVFFNYLGKNSVEVFYNLLFHPGLWIDYALTPSPWWFLALLLLPLGFTPLRYPPALVPVVPLVVFTLLDRSGYRAMVFNTYAVEYLGFLMAAILVGLSRAGTRVRVATLAAITLGAILSFNSLSNRDLWRVTFQQATHRAGEYHREAAFSACALGGKPALATSYYWATYVRGEIDSVWVDESEMPVHRAPWKDLETLVYPANPQHPQSLTNFPRLHRPFNIPHYAALMDRLQITVVTGTWWRYHGGTRLAECAARLGYMATRSDRTKGFAPDGLHQ